MPRPASVLLLVGAALLGIACATETLVGPFEGPLPPILPAPSGDAVAEFDIVDEAGAPFRPDRASWYAPPDEQGAYDEYEARCANQACTRWAVTGAPSGRVYVAAHARRDYPGDPYCVYSRYDATPVDVVPGTVPRVTLRLEEAVICA